MKTIADAVRDVASLKNYIENDLAKDIKEISLAEVKENFEKQTYVSDDTPAKDKWKPRGRYGEYEKFMNYPKLQRTGRLRDSFISIIRKKSGGSELVIGTNVKYARFQQDGYGWHTSDMIGGQYFKDGKSRKIYTHQTKGRKFLGMGRRTFKKIRTMMNLKFGRKIGKLNAF